MDVKAKSFKLGKIAEVKPKNEKHPLQKALIQNQKKEELTNFFTISHAINSTLPHHLKMQEFYIARPMRLPGLQCSNLGKELMGGGDVEMNFGDYLNYFPSEKGENLHEVMEEELGIDVKTRT